jgi:hypothetical protein
MGKKSDDAQNLVDEKTEDQHGSSNPSNSRKKRREKTKKVPDGMEMESTATLKPDRAIERDVKGGTAVEDQIVTNTEKKRPRDKRRKKIVVEEEVSDPDDEKSEANEASSETKTVSHRQKTSQSGRNKKSNKHSKISGSKVDLRDDHKEKGKVLSSDKIISENSVSRADKRQLRMKKKANKKEVSDDDDDETTRSSVNILRSGVIPIEQAEDNSSEEEVRPRKLKKNKDKSPRLKDDNKATGKELKQPSQYKRSKATKGNDLGSKEGSKQSLRGVDNPVYEEEDHEEYDDRNVYNTNLYGLDDDILDSPFEEEEDVDSDDEGKAYRLPPSASPINLSPASPYLLQPHFVSGSGNPNTLSEPVNQIYREKVPGRFSKTSQKKISTIAKFSSNQVEPHSTKPSMTPLDLGLECQKVFRAIGVFSHGFLAGMAFWQLLMVYILSQEGLLHEMFPGDCLKPDQIEYCDQLKFVELYSPLSQPLHLVFYLLTTICTVSIMDRYDIAQFDLRQLQMMFTFRSGGIAVAIYIITLIITLVSTRYDDKLSLHRHNETIYAELEQDVLASEISIWKALNLCRSIGVILGWFLISMRPNTDLLYKHLKKLSIFGGEKLSFNPNASLKA